jgi:hypothetical protein
MKPQPLSDEAEHLAVQQVLPWHVAGALSATEQAMVARHLETCAACRADLALQRQIRLAEPGLPDGLDAEAALARLMPQLDHVAQEPAPLAAALRGAAPAGVPGLPDAADGVAGGRTGPAGDAPGRTGTRAAAAGTAAAAARSGARAESHPAATPWRGWLRRLVDTFDGGGWRNWALAAQCVVIAGLGVLLWPAVGGPDAAAPAYRALGSGAVAAPDVVVMFQPDARLEPVQRVLQASGARIVDGPTVTGAYLVDVDAARMPQLLAALRADPAVRLAEPLGAGAAP